MGKQKRRGDGEGGENDSSVLPEVNTAANPALTVSVSGSDESEGGSGGSSPVVLHYGLFRQTVTMDIYIYIYMYLCM